MAGAQSAIAVSTFPCQHGFLPSKAHPEFMMTTYLPALIWSLSAFACLFIAKRRSLKTTAVRAILVVFLGPFAIPFVLTAKPEKRHLA
ncbi:hypothetical protein ACQ4WY_02340 [Janthinobacterium sp. LB2P49]|uniref:hypothetical protein n=1 Tax=Janthinobacterium sp. LB2P49 TaxID=3424198 RepID=UPI003F264741